MLSDAIICLTGSAVCASLGYLAAWLRYSPKLRRIQVTTWAAAYKFYSAKSRE